MELILPYQWSPRPYQQSLWQYLKAGGLRAVVCAHRRWGKDEVALHWTACAAHLRVGNYAHMLPKYAQARKAIWDAVNPHSGKKRIDEAFPLVLRKSTLDDEMKIVLANGSTWQVVGSDNYNSLMGTSYAGIVKSEEALSDPNAWGYLSPILRENQGWVLFISTPRGRNHFDKLFQTAQQQPGWFAQLSSNDETHRFTDAELHEELQVMQDIHGADYGMALWKQEYFCSFDAALPGSIWGDCIRLAESQGRIVDFEHDRTRPVYTAWDLGRTDDTAIWWYQFNGAGIDVLDYFASPFLDIHNEWRHEKSLTHILLARREALGVTYAKHALPHDARPRTLAAGGKSILQQLLDAATREPALGKFTIGKRLDVQEGIQAARATFPRCRFHQTRCTVGLDALRAYHREWNEETKKFDDTPAHDWASHGADAFRYLSLEWKIPKTTQPNPPLIDRLMDKTMIHQTFGQLKTAHLKLRRAARDWAMPGPS